MVNVEKLEVRHIQELISSGAQRIRAEIIPEEMKAVCQQPFAYAFIDDQGKIIGAAGAVELWSNRSELWAMLDRESGKHMVSIHRTVVKILKILPFRRLEATVDKDFEQGHRWVKLLGFTMEAETLRAYNPDGRDSSLYALIKEP